MNLSQDYFFVERQKKVVITHVLLSAANGTFQIGWRYVNIIYFVGIRTTCYELTITTRNSCSMSQKHNLANKESYGDINVIAIHSHYQVSSLQNGKIVKWRYAFIVPMTFSSSHFLYLPMIISEIVIFNTVSANLGYIIC